MTDSPFIASRRPPRREDLTVDDLTDLVKYVYAGMTQRIAELQFTLAELASTGKLDPEINMRELQLGWCFDTWEFLYHNTTARVRRERDTNDWDWDRFDDTYSNGRQVRHRVRIEPVETDDHWPFNKHLCDDDPICEYPRSTVYHVEEPPFYSTKRSENEEE
jgi:hypothetical protein